MEKQISELSTIELKAIAYDQIAQIELSQNNLKAINQELAKRSRQPQSENNFSNILQNTIQSV